MLTVRPRHLNPPAPADSAPPGRCSDVEVSLVALLRAPLHVDVHSVQAYIDNLKATGQCEDGVICGLDGTAWTGGLALSAEEGAALGAQSSRLRPRSQ
eukprot:COSAG04_NODE_235_length_19140_cov_47.925109_12_plen_98_part_00